MTEPIQLAKRQCVSNCVVPDCGTITCSADQVCVVSAQTCEACPQVSCAALSAPSSAAVSSPKRIFPVGVIAGVTISAALLALGLAYFLFLRRKKALQTQARADEAEADKQKTPKASMEMSPYSSVWLNHQQQSHVSTATLPVCLGPAMTEEVKDTLFFGADDVLRMSYAESLARASPEKRATGEGLVDVSPAIIQGVNQVTAQRAKPAMINFKLSSSKRQSPLVEERSGWEDDDEERSPVERDMIERDSLSQSAASAETARRTLSRNLTGDNREVKMLSFSRPPSA